MSVELAPPPARGPGTLRRSYVDDFLTRHIARIPPGSRVLDLGGHRLEKRGRFNLDLCDVQPVYADLSAAHAPHVQTDANRLPFQDGVFDVVICSELLEHVYEPAAVLREVHRVLSQRGTLLVCAPFLHRVHADPEDYARYTARFWRRVLAETGFAVEAVEQQGLFFSVAADLIGQYLSGSGLPGWLARLLRPYGSALRRWAVRKEGAARVRANPFLASFATGFGAMARKP
jgi:SAM-dependent methyltransferase